MVASKSKQKSKLEEAKNSLKPYIKKQLEKGTPVPQIKRVLIQRKWPEKIVEEVVDEVLHEYFYSKVPKTGGKLVYKKKSFFEKTNEIFFNPFEFFKEIRREPFENAIIYLALISIFEGFIALLSILISPNSIFSLYAGEIGLGGFKFALLLLIPIQNFLFAGILSAILYALFMFMKIKEDFFTAFKIVAYSLTPAILFGWAGWASIIFFLWSLALIYIGISDILPKR